MESLIRLTPEEIQKEVETIRMRLEEEGAEEERVLAICIEELQERHIHPDDIKTVWEGAVA